MCETIQTTGRLMLLFMFIIIFIVIIINIIIIQKRIRCVDSIAATTATRVTPRTMGTNRGFEPSATMWVRGAACGSGRRRTTGPASARSSCR